MAKSIFATLLKESGNEYAALAEDGIAAGDVSGFVDTGSLTFNAALSGSIWGGLASNKVTALAGEPSTGKTFFALSIAKDFLEKNKDGFVFYFETESAISKDMLVSRGIDTKRMAIVPVATVQEFRTQAVKILDTYSESEERPPMFFVLDSLGGLSTDKEITDIEAGKDTRDMTRAQLIRGAFRVLTLKLGKANVALLVTNHVYEVVGSYVPTKKMGGGCLARGTKIKTPAGDVSIEEVQVGNLVDTVFGPSMVTETFSFEDKDVYEITFDDGSVVKCSGDHRFLIEGEWVPAAMLAAGKNTLNTVVADITGPLDVYRQQIQENLLSDTRESKAA